MKQNKTKQKATAICPHTKLFFPDLCLLRDHTPAVNNMEQYNEFEGEKLWQHTTICYGSHKARKAR